MNIINQEIQRLFDFWISQHPESFHSFDMERMYDFVYSMFINEEYIDVESLSEILMQRKNWEEGYAEEQANLFMNKIENAFEILRYLKSKNRLG